MEPDLRNENTAGKNLHTSSPFTSNNFNDEKKVAAINTLLPTIFKVKLNKLRLELKQRRVGRVDDVYVATHCTESTWMGFIKVKGVSLYVLRSNGEVIENPLHIISPSPALKKNEKHCI